MTSTKLSKLLTIYLYTNGHKITKATKEVVETVHENKTWTFSTVRDGNGIYVEYLDSTLSFYRDDVLIKKTCLKSLV